MRDQTVFWLALAIAVFATVSGCGDAPSSFLREGRLPIYNFPLYATYGLTSGGIFRCETRDYSTCSRFPTSTSVFDNPQGIASDNFKNIWVVEKGTGRLLRFREGSADFTVCVTGLQSPSAVALDSSNQIYVSQDTPKNIVQVDCDQHQISSTAFQTFSAVVTGFVFGVDDFLAVTLSDNTVHFGSGSGALVSSVTNPTNLSVDSSGRFYISEEDPLVPNTGRVFRYSQDGSTRTQIVSGLNGVVGIAVDAGEDIYFIEQSTNAVQLIRNGTSAPQTYLSGIPSPGYIVMTRY